MKSHYINMWIFYSLLGAFTQIIRNLFSKKLTSSLTSETIALSRFIYAIPVVALALTYVSIKYGLPTINSGTFYLWVLLMAISQVLATYFRVSLFKYKNFAVSVTLVQVDTIIVAIVGVVFLSEYLNFFSWLGVIAATSGLIFASLSKNRVTLIAIKEALLSKASVIALLTGLFLALAGVFAKQATKQLSGITTVKSLYSLMHILIVEVIILLPIAYKSNRDSLKQLFLKPLQPLYIGVCSGIGSFAWLSAYSLTNLAYVRVVGQVEFIIASFITLYYFKEKLYKLEVLGIILVFLGTITLLFFK